MPGALAPTDANALLSAWRRSNGRTPSTSSRRVPGGAGLSRREEHALQRAAITPVPAAASPTSDGGGRVLPTVAHARGDSSPREHVVQLQRAVTPASMLGPSSGLQGSPTRPDGRHKASQVHRARNERSTRAVAEQLRAGATRKARLESRDRAARAATIAASPQRMLREMRRSETAVAEGERRERDFDLTTHVEHTRDVQSGAITPRHVKAQYVRALQEAEAVATVSPKWLRRHVRPASSTEKLPPIDGTAGIEEITEQLQRRSAVKASRRGLPPSAEFTELSDAIGAVVVAAKAGRRSPPPRGLCGDTMCYWDRVNVYNRYRESLGAGGAKK